MVFESALKMVADIARRSGQEWYAGSITNWDPRKLELPLNFLDETPRFPLNFA